MKVNGIILALSLCFLTSSCKLDEPIEDQNPIIGKNNPGKIEDLTTQDRDIARRICNAYISKKNNFENYGDGEVTLSYGISDFGCNDEGYNYQGNLAAVLRVPVTNHVYLETRSSLRFIGDIETDEVGMLSLEDYCTKVLKDNMKTHVQISGKLIRYRFLNINGNDILETGTYIEAGDGHKLQRMDSFVVDTNKNSGRYGLVLERAQSRYCNNDRQTGFKQVLR